MSKNTNTYKHFNKMIHSRFGMSAPTVRILKKDAAIWIMNINNVPWAIEKELAIYFLKCNKLNHLL